MNLTKICQWVIRGVEDDFMLVGLWFMIWMLAAVPHSQQPWIDPTIAVLIVLCTAWTGWGILKYERRARAIAVGITTAVTSVAYLALCRRDAIGGTATAIIFHLAQFQLGVVVGALSIRFVKRA